MEEEVTYDLDSYDVVTEALLHLVNQFPALDDDTEISFSVLDGNGGIGFFPSSGGIVSEEVEDIIGHVEQTCIYPFTIIYRSGGLSESRKAGVKEWLDMLGKWLEKQTITVNNTSYTLNEYPKLTGDREMKLIERTTPSFLYSTTEDRIDDWAVSMRLTYRNEFNRN